MKQTQYEILFDQIQILKQKMEFIISDLKIINQKLYAVEDKIGNTELTKLTNKYKPIIKRKTPK